MLREWNNTAKACGDEVAFLAYKQYRVNKMSAICKNGEGTKGKECQFESVEAPCRQWFL